MAARSPKSRQHQKRRAAQREPRRRVLIVCEGTKTEKNYFENARDVMLLPKGLAKVDVAPGEGSDPCSVVNTAKKRKKRADSIGNAFDEIYCVFDRDEHARYDEAVSRARQSGFTTIKSVPCFEYWVLLHYSNQAAPYHRTANRSPGQNCLRDVKGEWPEYAKGAERVFEQLQERLPQARRRAAARLRAARQEDNMNPSTEVHLLIDALEKLNKDTEQE